MQSCLDNKLINSFDNHSYVLFYKLFIILPMDVSFLNQTGLMIISSDSSTQNNPLNSENTDPGCLIFLITLGPELKWMTLIPLLNLSVAKVFWYSSLLLLNLQLLLVSPLLSTVQLTLLSFYVFILNFLL